MVVVKLESLPLGFRFHPTDEELINHYLKGKIKGRKSQVEVIPEIDVCKWEPWDLPDKSVIKTLDPEWFFFAARDRKYPNGHRSNRATGAGYWKATGKDRNIKSRASPGATLIGMKKTLVFYCGRAPKGERTGWIMHEYRIVDGEVDGKSSDQGDYVLCRLFKKPLDKSMNANDDELDEDGLSLTPVKSSLEDTQHEVEVGDISSDQYVMSKNTQYKQPLSGWIQPISPNLPPVPLHTFSSKLLSPPSVFSRFAPAGWAAREWEAEIPEYSNNYPILAPKQQQDQVDNINFLLGPVDSNSNSNSNITLRGDSEVPPEAEDGISLNDLTYIDDLTNSYPLSPFATSEVEKMDSSGVNFGFSFDKTTNNEIVMESAKNDSAEDGALNAFLDSILLDPEKEFNDQQHSFSIIQSNQMHQIDGLHDAFSPKLSCDETIARTQLQTQNVESDFNSEFYSSMDSWESLYKFSQTVQDRTVTNSFGNGLAASSGPFKELLNDNLSDFSSKEVLNVDTGIQIRPRAPKQSIATTSNQGNATRRIRLQRKLQVECSLLSETISNEPVCDLKVEEDSQQKNFHAEDAYRQADPIMFRNSHPDEICLDEKASDLVDVVTVLSSASKVTSQTSEPADKICMEEKSSSVMDSMNQSDSVVRRRKVLCDDAGAIQNRSSTDNPQGTKRSASVSLVFGGILLILLVIIIGMWNYL